MERGAVPTLNSVVLKQNYLGNLYKYTFDESLYCWCQKWLILLQFLYKVNLVCFFKKPAKGTHFSQVNKERRKATQGDWKRQEASKKDVQIFICFLINFTKNTIFYIMLKQANIQQSYLIYFWC